VEEVLLDAFDLARLQFAITTTFHFFFVPLSVGLAFITAIMQTSWVRTEDPEYLRMTRPAELSTRHPGDL
jgi:cytochrome d ubiquinol oxidase subunit I